MFTFVKRSCIYLRHLANYHIIKSMYVCANNRQLLKCIKHHGRYKMYHPRSSCSMCTCVYFILFSSSCVPKCTVCNFMVISTLSLLISVIRYLYVCFALALIRKYMYHEQCLYKHVFGSANKSIALNLGKLATLLLIVCALQMPLHDIKTLLLKKHARGGLTS